MRTVHKKLLLTLTVLVLNSYAIFAVPACPYPIEKTQPDGTKITVYLRGDEFVHWLESPDGYTLLYAPDGYVVYAIQDEKGDLTPSAIRYGSELRAAQQNNIPKGLRYSQSQIAEIMRPWQEAENLNAQLRSAELRASAIGNKKALCILVDFPDNQFSFQKSDFEAMMNEEGYSRNGSRGSVKDFYKENSYGALNMTVTVVGPYRMSGNYETYMTNSAPNHRYVSSAFVREVLDAANADGLNFQDFADNNVLETFHIIFAGQGDETVGDGKRIWSHKSAISKYTLDGVAISTYSCSPEIYKSNQITNIGVICHELGHVFGAPDYYDTNGDTGGNFTGSGDWDLMAGGNWNSNGTSPAHINMFQKILFGWVTPTELTYPQVITNMPNSAENPVAYTFKTGINEMYVLENRQWKLFDSGLPGYGLLIWHIHSNAVTGRASNNTHPQQVYPVCAGATSAVPNSTPASYGAINSSATPFGGLSRVRDFSANTVPMLFRWLDNQATGQGVIDIEGKNGLISFVYIDNTIQPVTNLSAEKLGSSVILRWDAPSSNTATGYKIYENDALVAEIDNPQTLQYSLPAAGAGYHKYGVSAKYPIMESQIIYSGLLFPSYYPVTNLTAQVANNGVNLEWQAPTDNEWLKISNGKWKSTWKLSGSDFFLGTLWEPEDMVNLNGFQISEVKFIARDATAQYSIEIYRDNETTKERELVYSQPLNTENLNTGNSLSTALNTVALENPYIVDASKSIIVGIHVQNPTTYFVVVDDDTQGSQKNIVRADGVWKTLSSYVSSGSPINANFFFETHFALPPTFTREYEVFRNFESIGSTEETRFTDAELSGDGTYNYCVAAKYAGYGESETVCKDVLFTGIADVTYNQTRIYAVGGKVFAESEASNPIKEVGIFNTEGIAVYSAKNINSAKFSTEISLQSPGIYIVRVISERGASSEKLVIK
ncbi:MAG: M6 family metalloprotease domain-containing protein [Dysgonamonadaceae bacterium]|jgi:M6 family metalloprotease-like protein|nr:M6 family metalloprotease domain-containing protein [Dysgonamonadaceae bacterium]